MIAAALAEGESLLSDFLSCEDTLYTAGTLEALGVDISDENGSLRVKGVGGKFPSIHEEKELFMGNSGTSFRLLLSIAALAKGSFIMTGTPRMKKRPIGTLVKALSELGAGVSCLDREGYPPVRILPEGIRGGTVHMPGDQSSQFISSILMCAPYAQYDVEVHVTGDLVSRPYLDITTDVMARFGVAVEREGYRRFKINAGQGYQAGKYTIPGDASSASYFWAAAAITGGAVVTENIHPFQTRQGDIHLLDILEKMGAVVERQTDRVHVHADSLQGIEVDMSAMPDMVPTLAAIALFAQGRTVIKNVPHLRLKESDRLAAVAVEWNRLGAGVEELEDGLVIHGGRRLIGASVDPHDDHRLAMSLAVIGLKVPGVKIEDEGCVAKSFPHFWDLWDLL
jgi:3-phosphoshikimate 1-carboxyvinyltransferase